MEIGWIAAIVVGGIAGRLAEQFMKSDMELSMKIVLGVQGAARCQSALSFMGFDLGPGWGGYLIAGFYRRGYLIFTAGWSIMGVIENLSGIRDANGGVSLS